MTLFKIVILALIMGGLVAGCASPGTLISRQAVDDASTTTAAPVDGNYGLFIAGQSHELVNFPLKKDQPIGFRREDQGAIRWLFAVAGEDHVPLDITKTYEWRRQP